MLSEKIIKNYEDEIKELEKKIKSKYLGSHFENNSSFLINVRN